MFFLFLRQKGSYDSIRQTRVSKINRRFESEVGLVLEKTDKKSEEDANPPHRLDFCLWN